jgi:hypothetical protein
MLHPVSDFKLLVAYTHYPCTAALGASFALVTALLPDLVPPAALAYMVITSDEQDPWQIKCKHISYPSGLRNR